MNNNNVLVFSIALGDYSSVFSSCIRTQRDYCSKHGFEYVVVDKEPRKLKSSEAAWLKIFLLRSALKCKYDWIGFIDADCEIRSHAPSFVESFIKYEQEKSIFLATGFSGRINSGVIFLKNTPKAIRFLEDVISHGDKEVPNEDKALYENGHMIHFGKTNPDVRIIESWKWNNNVEIDKNSYIQHYSGGILREKYLINRGISKPSLSLWSKIRIKLFPQKRKISMKGMNLILRSYLKIYPEFNPVKENNL